ncbi:MAG: phospholipase D-like domain-containing protein [Acidobacteriota bacterium]|nr:phospholipase D-like domain-containing protein [Acidobacteriota bacterium]
MRFRGAILGVFSCAVLATEVAYAEERLCDASRENCRVPLVQLIDSESVGIDVGVWFIKDGRIPAALIRARSRGVPVRMIMDTRANTAYTGHAQYIADMAAAGVQVRRRTAGDICHWKLMIFERQHVVQWSGANYSSIGFVPIVPYRDYEDEVIHFSRQLADSFKKVFDDIWTNTTQYADYANITRPLVRRHPIVAVDPRLNFPPQDSYQDRLIPLIDREPSHGLIDVDMYRLTLARPVDAIIRAAARGVRVRMYLEPRGYANTKRPGNKVNIDRLVAAAATYPGTIEIRMRSHMGLNHQKTVWLHSQRVVVFGTSNWSDASDNNQLEANFFTDRIIPGDTLGERVFTELNRIFERKFYNEAPDGSIETVAWRTPSLPRPTISLPTTCTDPAANNHGGALPCTYDPEPPMSDAPTVVIWAGDTTSSSLHGNWRVVADPTAAGGRALANSNFSQAKITPAFTDPPNYFEATFSARADTPYHLWVRMRAENNSFGNDSVHVQFSDSVTATRVPTMRIGSTSSAEIVLQAGAGDGSVNGWGWADNTWDIRGPDVYFSATGTHTVRIQQREDGAIVDQIVLSPNVYLNAAPGARDGDNTRLPATETGGAEPVPALPVPWQTSNIGSATGGGASVSGGVFTVAGGGADIWGTADAFRYVYQPLPGDGVIVARLASVQNVHAWTKAGVMLRQTLSAGSAHASMFVTPVSGLAFQSRASSGGTSVSAAVAGAAPCWVRLVRAGQLVTASVSEDGATWTTVGQRTLSFSGTVYAGLAVTSHNSSQVAAATLDRVTLSSPQP